MIPYFSLFFAFSIFAILAKYSNNIYSLKQFSITFAWPITFFTITLMIGLRNEVGGDWFAYLRHYELSRTLSLDQILNRTDPGYFFINYVSANLELGIVGVNTISGLIFSVGLCSFCRTLPRPWLAIAVAIPYLVIVVAMGYSRQGVALGFAMLGLVSIGKSKYISFVIWMILAATFHRTAILLLPFAALALNKNRFLYIPLIAVALSAVYFSFFEESADSLYRNYISNEYRSSGALVRILMNLTPAIIFLILMKRFRLNAEFKNIVFYFSLSSVGLLILFIAGVPSTALDRIGLYFLPLQMIVFSYIPSFFPSLENRYQLVSISIIIIYGAVLIVWLNFAVNAPAWIPYSMIAI